MRLVNSTLIFILLFTLALIVFTVYKATSKPVVLENKYMGDYKSIDREYAQILKDEIIFDKEINFSYNLSEDFSKLTINLASKNNQINLQPKITGLLTRPHTKKDDKKLESIKVQNSHIVNIPSTSKGRWTIIIKIEQTIDNKNVTKFKEIPFSISSKT